MCLKRRALPLFYPLLRLYLKSLAGSICLSTPTPPTPTPSQASVNGTTVAATAPRDSERAPHTHAKYGESDGRAKTDELALLITHTLLRRLWLWLESGERGASEQRAIAHIYIVVCYSCLPSFFPCPLLPLIPRREHRSRYPRTKRKEFCVSPSRILEKEKRHRR
jgi:hypothetical protein